MSDETIGERIAALGRNLPAEALEHLATATDQEAAQREWEQTRAYVTTLEDENVRLRNALTELYAAAHGYLNQTNGRGRMRAGTPRLNAALAAAGEALHEQERF